jgi:predicted restriction endonuclease
MATLSKELYKMAISNKTRKNLWAKSGNRCAFCKIELFTEKESTDKFNIGEECHIISSKTNGPRHKPNLDDYDTFDNLLMLCRNHHKEIDELTDTYSEEVLRYMKQKHENWVNETLNKEINSEKNKDQKFLIRITSGKELMNIIFNAFGYRTDFDEIETEEEADYIGSVLQTFVDYGEISNILETHEKVKISLEFNEMLKELEQKGYFLFGEKTLESCEGIDNCQIATLLIKRKDSNEIIKMNIDEDE